MTKQKKKQKKKLVKAVLRVLQDHAQKQMNHKQVAWELSEHMQADKGEVKRILEEESKKGRIRSMGKGKYQAIPEKAYINGRIDMTKGGAAYVISDDLDEDVFIAPNDLGHALHEDLVKVYLYAKRKRKNPKGEVVEVLERARTTFVGKLEVTKDFAFLIPDGQKMHVDLYIPLNKLAGAKDGEKAIGAISDWPEKATNPFGYIEKRLGKPGVNDVEMHAILAEYGLPYEFPQKVEKAAAELSGNIEEETAKRKDFREVPTFTIDPDDARDYDDALSLRELENGEYEVGIHIADVSYYVTRDSIIDQEAVKRATSVYLVDRVVPMLPERLSNDLCSLRPEEDRLAFSAIFRIDQKAEVRAQWFGRTVIRSDRRFTYDQAQANLNAGNEEFSRELGVLDDLAKRLRKARVKKGSLEIESDEVKFELDKEGNPLGVYPKKILDTNLLIEEMMLLANQKVAAFIGKRDDPLPFIYRVHDKPDEEKLQMLREFVHHFGYKLEHKPGKPISYAINQLLKSIKGEEAEGVISHMAVRSMAKAEYNTENIGHYGLAFSYYTHFTSPIRRYPDLEVHRLLDRYLREKKTASLDHLDSVSKNSSIQERRAIDAERDSIKYKQVEYLQDRIGDTFQGVVAGVTDWGIFVELEENKCEGMIHLRSISDDLYYFDERHHKIIGSKFGRTFELGDRIKVVIKEANLEKKQLTFLLAPEEFE